MMKKMMKRKERSAVKRRILALALAVLLVLPLGTVSARAEESPYVPAEPEDGDVAPEAKAECRQILEDYGYVGGDCEYFLLFNRENEAGYVLAANSAGYVILNREDLKFMEAGEGGNPYAGYMDCRKYYSEGLCYYVKLKKGTDRYWDIHRETEVRWGSGLWNLRRVCLYIDMAVTACLQTGREVSGE